MLLLLMLACPAQRPSALVIPTGGTQEELLASIAQHEALLQRDPALVVDRYNLACAYALLGRREEALAELRQVLDAGMDLGAEVDPDFASLRGDPDFEALVEQFDALYPSVHRSERAFWVGERTDLAPSGLAHDPATGRFFVGSMRTGTIFSVRDGLAQPFATLKVGEIPLSVHGMAVDAARGRLWAVGTAAEVHEAWLPAHQGTTAVLGLDLATGELRESHARAPGPTDYGFINLALAGDGTIYLSGTSLSVLPPGQEAPAPLLTEPRLRYSNAIALGEPGTLYLGTPEGIARLDLASGQHTLLQAPEGSHLRDFTSLQRAEGAWVGVQYGTPWRVLRLDLDPTGAAVVGAEILEQDYPQILDPLAGVIVGDELFFAAHAPAPRGATSWGAGRAAVWRTKIRP